MNFIVVSCNPMQLGHNLLGVGSGTIFSLLFLVPMIVLGCTWSNDLRCVYLNGFTIEVSSDVSTFILYIYCILLLVEIFK